MTIADLRKQLTDARISLGRGKNVPAARVRAWAAALERIDSDPGPESWLFSAQQLHLRAAQGNRVSLRTEITIVLAKLEHWKPCDPEPALDA